MIEKNSEVQPVLAVNENSFVEKDFFDSLDRESKNNKNGHGEDLTVNVLTLFSELYNKKIVSSGEVKPSTIKDSQSENKRLSASEVISSMKKRQSILMTSPQMNALKESKQIKGEDTNQPQVTLLSTLRPPEIAKSSINFTGKIIHNNDDETREKSLETIKAHSVTTQLKSDSMALRQELQSQDMKPRTAQSLIPDRMLQANSAAITEPATQQKQSLNLDYPFVRWSGEHSVKVSIPVDLARAGNLTLLPSDTRAAEILSRQMGQLNGYTTELLHPQQDDDESEQRHAQQTLEEDQE